VIGQPPAELLRDLERECLAALGIERPEVHVDERPALLVGDLQPEPVDVVVGAVDADDGGAVREGVVDLGGLQVGRDEDEGPQAGRSRRRGRRPSEVAGRRAGDRVEAELDRSGDRDRNNPVLEAQRRVAGVVLEPQPVDAEVIPVVQGNDSVKCLYVGVVFKVAGPYEAFLRTLKSVQGAKDFLQVRIEDLSQKSANEERILKGELQFLSFRLAEGAELEKADEGKKPARKPGRRKVK